MIKPRSHPDYKRNAERVRGGAWACAICGKPVNLDSPKAHWLNIVDMGDAFGSWDADPDAPGFMGAFPIGGDCWRKHRAELEPLERPEISREIREDFHARKMAESREEVAADAAPGERPFLGIDHDALRELRESVADMTPKVADFQNRLDRLTVEIALLKDKIEKRHSKNEDD